jgi:hypothetical protein
MLPHDAGGGEGVPRAAARAATATLLPPAPSLLLSTIFTAISITYAVVHPPTHLCTVLFKHGI